MLACEPAEEADEPAEPTGAEQAAEPDPVVQEPIVGVESSMINYGHEYGREYFGLFAEPEDMDELAEARGLDPAAELPGLLIVHGPYGLDETVQNDARRFAGEGFRVLAVDLFDGDTAETEEEAAGLVEAAQIDMGLMLRSLETAHDYMLEQENVSRLGIVGWSFGGGSAFQALANWPESFDAAVIFYGEVEGLSPPDLDGFDGPILLIIGEEDDIVDPQAMESFRDEFTEAGYEVEVLQIENAGHDFANPLADTYDEEAAELAYEEAVYFLEQHLRAEEAEDEMEQDPAS